MIYELSFGGWEYTNRHLLTNPNNPTQEQFRSDVIKLLKEYGEEYLSQENSWADGERWVWYVIDKLLDKLAELGYSKLKPVSTYFQTPSIISEGQGFWEEVVGTDLFDSAVEHNKKLCEEMGFKL